jgi:hypothetical protein
MLTSNPGWKKRPHAFESRLIPDKMWAVLPEIPTREG